MGNTNVIRHLQLKRSKKSRWSLRKSYGLRRKTKRTIKNELRSAKRKMQNEKQKIPVLLCEARL